MRVTTSLQSQLRRGARKTEHMREQPAETAMRNGKTALVTGAGGFIGHHLVNYLIERNYVVRGVDLKHPEYEATKADEFIIADLREHSECLHVTKGVDEVYHLAADMGGIGYISAFHAEISINN